MDDLKTLTEFLEMTDRAQEMLSDFGKSKGLRSLLLDMRKRVREESKQLGHHRKGTRYDLCLIGILEEIYYFDKTSWENVVGLDQRLARIREEIERTIQEMKSKRTLM